MTEYTCPPRYNYYDNLDCDTGYDKSHQPVRQFTRDGGGGLCLRLLQRAQVSSAGAKLRRAGRLYFSQRQPLTTHARAERV